MNCRHCHKALSHVFLDLGSAPPSNAFLSAQDLQARESYFPLKIYVCDNCWLVQTEDHAAAEQLFEADYAYYSSISTSWLDHARRYAEMIIPRLGLGPDSLVMEIAANDGYLLRNFVAAKIPCLGIEPTSGTAAAARELGISIREEFFGSELATQLVGEGMQADLIIGNNVFAHVPDINDFTAGMKEVLKPGGTVTLEFPHLMRLIAECQFDTIYHEHFSYLSPYTVQRIFAAQGLRVFDVEELDTHGGSLRLMGCHDDDARVSSHKIEQLLSREEQSGLRGLQIYRGFQAVTDRVRNDVLAFLTEQQAAGRAVAGYGAAAKGNTLLNYAGVKADLLPYIVDAAPSKQGKFTPGGHIPVLDPEVLRQRRPDYVLILPWNIAAEVTSQHGYIAEWGGKFVVAVPALKVL